MNKTLGIVIGVVGAALLGAVAATIATVYYFKTAQQTASTAQQQQTVSQALPDAELNSAPPVQEESVPQPLTPTVQEQIKDPGVVWLRQPQRITRDLKLFRIPDADYIPPENLPPGMRQPPKDTPVEAEYYKTGTDNGNDIIMALIPPEGPGDNLRAYLRKTSAGTYEYIQRNSDNYDPEQDQFYSAKPIDDVRINTTLLYASIETQKTISYKNVVLERMSSLFFDRKKSEKKREQVAQTPYGLLYSETQSGPIKELTVQSFILTKPNGLEETYQYTPQNILRDTMVADVVWNDGTRNTDTFLIMNTTGCGAGPYLPLLSESEIAKITPIGKTSKGETVYGFSDPNDPVIQYLYKGTNGTYYGSDGKTHAITLKEFQAIHPALIAKDALGRHVLFNNSTWGPAVECGKPVIYLYPQKPTDVAVRVDADVTKSDPEYKNGWNVHALPDGILFNNNAWYAQSRNFCLGVPPQGHTEGGGLSLRDFSAEKYPAPRKECSNNTSFANQKSYDSLFWEGTGHGTYPDIRRGTIVEKKNLAEKLRDDLSRLGLNSKESNDFLEFWLPHMPTTPYTRLSWLVTSDMNTLAPLTITPKPDTLIRIFLDFEGLDKPINMQPQLFPTTPSRTGFSVVEWGGLLRR